MITDSPQSATSPPVPPPNLPIELPRYHSRFLLGHGGMCCVYSAIDETLEAEVAIKVVRPDRPNQDDAKARLATEARILSKLSHRNIIKFRHYDHSEDGQPYLVLERIVGISLKERVKLSISIDELLYIFTETTKALAYIHEKRIIHRDIKPSNILLAVEPELPFQRRVVLCDFGIALEQDALSRLTESGVTPMTPAYAAPEQHDCDGKVTDHTDVFLLGVVMYECLTGTFPYSGDDDRKAPTPVTEFRPGLSPRLGALILRMLERDQSGRPSAQEVLATLDEIASSKFNPTIDRTGTASTEPRGVLQRRSNSSQGAVSATLRVGFWDGVYSATLRIRWWLAGCSVLVAVGVVGWGMTIKKPSGVVATLAAAPPGMVLIPGGSFQMGSTAAEQNRSYHECRQVSTECEPSVFQRESSLQWVTMSPFYIHETEVINAQFVNWINHSGMSFHIEHGREVKHDDNRLLDLYKNPQMGIGYDLDRKMFYVYQGFEDLPVVQVSWFGAAEYCAGNGLRLPTEAEYEYAARSASNFRGPWTWGDARPTCTDAVFDRNAGQTCGRHGARPVQVKTPRLDVTRQGVFGLSDNVEEWTYEPYVARRPDCADCKDPILPDSGQSGLYAATRGGSWGSSAYTGHIAGRSRFAKKDVSSSLGFRCVYKP